MQKNNDIVNRIDKDQKETGKPSNSRRECVFVCVRTKVAFLVLGKRTKTTEQKEIAFRFPSFCRRLVEKWQNPRMRQVVSYDYDCRQVRRVFATSILTTKNIRFKKLKKIFLISIPHIIIASLFWFGDCCFRFIWGINDMTFSFIFNKTRPLTFPQIGQNPNPGSKDIIINNT